VGFEPTVGFPLRLISSQVPLTTQPPFLPTGYTDSQVRIVPDIVPGTETATTTSMARTKPCKLSSDRKWRSFSDISNLIQYVPTGVFWAKIKVRGKVIRECLHTDVLTTAKLRARDFVCSQQSRHAHRGNIIATMQQARSALEAEIRADYQIADGTKLYYQETLQRIWRLWPQLDRLDPHQITSDQVKAFANRAAAKCGGSVFNNLLLLLRRLFKTARVVADPSRDLKRKPAAPRVYDIPTPIEFEQIAVSIQSQPGRHGRDAANLARLLALTGCRRGEARALTWGDVDFQQGLISIPRGKQRVAGGGVTTRITTLPMSPALRVLLQRMHEEQGAPGPECNVALVKSCDGALKAACLRLGRKPLTHHSLRHCFVSWCLGQGVPVRVVAEWAGHRDGGALILRVYAHVLARQSVQWAQQLAFGGPSQQ
jgi:integrase